MLLLHPEGTLLHHSLHKTFLQSAFMHQAQNIDYTTALLPSTDINCVFITAHSHIIAHCNSVYVYLSAYTAFSRLPLISEFAWHLLILILKKIMQNEHRAQSNNCLSSGFKSCSTLCCQEVHPTVEK